MKLNTICIIDDDPIFVYGTKILLNHNKDFGDDVLVYENGKEALDNLSSILRSGQKLPNIIFLDLNMPFMDGWQFLDAFIQLPISEQPLIFITTSSINQEDKDRALHYKIVKEFLIKPLYDSQLKKLFEKYN
ncbi:response regulator [Maribacter sp. X9]|uniref:response regulator n=1 Tax=Maribacter sp. X9 TaxID=3402159 RepID=UPI003AF38FA1